MNKRCTSVHSAGIEQIHEMPLNEIIRPIPPQVDEGKVKSLMDTLSVSILSILQYLMMIKYKIKKNNSLNKKNISFNIYILLNRI